MSETKILDFDQVLNCRRILDLGFFGRNWSLVSALFFVYLYLHTRNRDVAEPKQLQISSEILKRETELTLAAPTWLLMECLRSFSPSSWYASCMWESMALLLIFVPKSTVYWRRKWAGKLFIWVLLPYTIPSRKNGAKWNSLVLFCRADLNSFCTFSPCEFIPFEFHCEIKVQTPKLIKIRQNKYVYLSFGQNQKCWQDFVSELQKWILWDKWQNAWGFEWKQDLHSGLFKTGRVGW